LTIGFKEIIQRGKIVDLAVGVVSDSHSSTVECRPFRLPFRRNGPPVPASSTIAQQLAMEMLRLNDEASLAAGRPSGDNPGETCIFA